MGQELVDRGRANDQMFMKRIHALGQMEGDEIKYRVLLSSAEGSARKSIAP
jgi:hypothetical protein